MSKVSCSTSMIISCLGLSKLACQHLSWFRWCLNSHHGPCTISVIQPIRFFFFTTPSFQKFLPFSYILKYTFSRRLRYFLIGIYLNVCAFYSGRILLNMDLIFRANINSAGDIPDLVLGFGIILKTLRNCCNLSSSDPPPIFYKPFWMCQQSVLLVCSILGDKGCCCDVLYS